MLARGLLDEETCLSGMPDQRRSWPEYGALHAALRQIISSLLVFLLMLLFPLVGPERVYERGMKGRFGEV